MRISDWSSDVCSSDLARVVERLAEGGDDRGQVEPGGEPGRERRSHDHEQRIEAEQEARDDDEDADQNEHDARPDGKSKICSRGDAETRREYPKNVCAELVEALFFILPR